MAQKALGYYSFEQNVLTLNGVRLGNFADSGGVSYERGSQPRDSMSSPDGYTTAYRNSDQRLILTLEVMETSASYPYLWDLYRASIAAEDIGQRPPLYLWAHADLITGEAVTDAQALFLNVGTPSKGREPGTRSFVLLLPYGADAIEPARLNTVNAGLAGALGG